MPAELRPCKRCGMKITFIRNAETGGNIPAQPIRTAYALDADGELNKGDLPRGSALFVSHFETCPNAKEFRRKK